MSELEGRSLQATVAPPPADPTPTYVVGFGITQIPPYVSTQVVSQQNSSATVILSRAKSWTRAEELPVLNVQVTTDATSPYVGVNVGAVDQTVTFASGQLFAALTVPIIPGAPNPGVVDVNLTMTPIAPPPDLNISVPVSTLKILGSETSTMPTIVATNGTPQGIELVFNTSMDPVQASNVKNYAVISSGYEPDNDLFSALGSMGSIGKRVSRRVPLKSAVYDTTTNTVTLIPRRRLNYPGPYGQSFHSLFVTQGRQTHAARGPNARTGAVLGLVDLAKHPIHQSSSPPMPLGMFRVSVVGALRPVNPGE
jgi:hypothetical protein